MVSFGISEILQVTIGKKLTVLSGTDVKLNCPADGVPLPDAFWTKDGTNITYVPGKLELERTSLLVTNISQSDKGDYICVVYNSAGRDMAESKIAVLCK